MSNALSRLRLFAHDDLFVRTSKEMRPTPRAIELAGPICDALKQIRIAFSSEPFDPATTGRHFVIGASDDIDSTLTASVLFYQGAPHAQFSLVESSSLELAFSMLDAGSIDIAMGNFALLPKRLDSALLYSEHYVCVARRGHPDLAAGLTLEKFVTLPHLSIIRDKAGIVEAALARQNLTRRIVAQVPFYALARNMLEGTDWLAVVGERIARDFSTRANIECHTVPLDLQPREVCAAWVRQRNPDGGVLWLVSLLRKAANSSDISRSAYRSSI